MTSPVISAVYKVVLYFVYLTVVYLMTLSVTDCIAFNHWMTENNELERMWKVVVMT